ncbi:cysteine protease family C01A [Thraustotheca clavata]|uniref:Cysteine protease family C01A n=1 Tax=Thraustotheca clavata TaxID=74557 RepID=A0A0A7CLQ7_9STRA|nr:secreted protein [Thraustotheca clavata]OQS05797.1 cysteine protease family C01A [Thraustotheca clavata]
MHRLLLICLYLVGVFAKNKTLLSAKFKHWRTSKAGLAAEKLGFIQRNWTEEEYLRRYFNGKIRLQKLRDAYPLAQFDLTQFSLLSHDEFRSFVDPELNFTFNASSIERYGYLTSNWSILTTDNDTWRINVQAGTVVAPPKPKKGNIKTPATFTIDHSGCLTPPRNQGRCGSCWAFASTSAIEGAYCVKHNKRIALSEQYMASCDTSNFGCGGGSIPNALSFARTGMCTLEAQPFRSGATGKISACMRCSSTIHTGINGYRKVTSNVAAFQAALAKSPIAVAVSAGNRVWQHYTGGILTAEVNASAPVDHGVTIVGYGIANNTLVWKIRNSWGTNWGEDGYLLLAANTNLFSVLNQGFVPVL